MTRVRRQSLPLGRLALPAPGCIEFWLANLDRLPLDSTTLPEGRMQRLLKRRVHQQFLLRLLLAAYLGIPGKSVRLVRSGQGKPHLDEKVPAQGLTFNLSHTGEWLAVAVGRDCRIGVDIEPWRRRSNAAQIARRYFPAETARWLQVEDEPLRSRLFLQQWTAREALVKAVGEGLAGNLDRIGLSGQPPVVHSLPPDWPPPSRWTLQELRLPGDLLGHLAVDQPDISVQVVQLDTGPGAAP